MLVVCNDMAPKGSGDGFIVYNRKHPMRLLLRLLSDSSLVLRSAFITVLAIFLFVPPATAQLVNGRLITSVYAWQRFDTVDVSKTYARGFQSVLLEIAQSDFSINTHFQAATMLQAHLDELPDYRFYYLYGKWRNIGDMVDLSFGRLPYFAGAGYGTLDGILAAGRFAGSKVRVTLYGGETSPVGLEFNSWRPIKNNFTLGGQLLTTVFEDTRIGVSYVNKNRERIGYYATRLDSLNNPFTFFVEPELAKEQYVSGDVFYSFDMGHVYGRYDYDLNYKQTQRGQVSLHVDVIPVVIATGDYIHREPRLPFGSFFSVFNVSANDEFELGVDYKFMPGWRAFVRGAFVKYTDDNSIRYTAGVAQTYASLSFRGSGGYAGELANVSVQGSYPLLDRMLIPMVGVSYVSYKLNKQSERENTLAAVVGATVRPLKQFSADIQGQWLTNKIYKKDFRLFAKLNFWFAERLNIFD